MKYLIALSFILLNTIPLAQSALSPEIERVLGREGRMQINFDGIIVGRDPNGKELTCHLGFDKQIQDQLIIKGSFYQDEIWWAYIDLLVPFDGQVESETLFITQRENKNNLLCGVNIGNGVNIKKVFEIKKGAFRLGIHFTCLPESQWPLGDHYLEVVCNLEEK